MESENETVAEIREDVHEYLTSIGPGEYPDETQFEEFADRFVAAHKREICDLSRRLKVAEDALVESKVAVCHTCNSKGYCGYEGAKFDPCRVYKDIDKALASIREEGGVK